MLKRALSGHNGFRPSTPILLHKLGSRPSTPTPKMQPIVAAQDAQGDEKVPTEGAQQRVSIISIGSVPAAFDSDTSSNERQNNFDGNSDEIDYEPQQPSVISSELSDVDIPEQSTKFKIVFIKNFLSPIVEASFIAAIQERLEKDYIGIEFDIVLATDFSLEANLSVILNGDASAAAVSEEFTKKVEITKEKLEIGPDFTKTSYNEIELQPAGYSQLQKFMRSHLTPTAELLKSQLSEEARTSLRMAFSRAEAELPRAILKNESLSRDALAKKMKLASVVVEFEVATKNYIRESERSQREFILDCESLLREALSKANLMLPFYKKEAASRREIINEMSHGFSSLEIRARVIDELKKYKAEAPKTFNIRSKSRTENSKINHALAGDLVLKLEDATQSLFEILSPKNITTLRDKVIEKEGFIRSAHPEMNSKKLQGILNRARASFAQTFEGKKALIIQALEAYASDAPKRTFTFFKEERSKSRRYNINLANRLVKQLKETSDPAIIEKMFRGEEIQALRNSIIDDPEYHRGINSKQLNKALELAHELFPVSEQTGPSISR